jgi:hypothetical protein
MAVNCCCRNALFRCTALVTCMTPVQQSISVSLCACVRARGVLYKCCQCLAAAAASSTILLCGCRLPQTGFPALVPWFRKATVSCMMQHCSARPQHAAARAGSISPGAACWGRSRSQATRPAGCQGHRVNPWYHQTSTAP